MSTSRMRIFLTGVGGQGTLTATRLLAQTALDAGARVTAGEIHGMAQRGGVVESFVLVGGYQSPRIFHGEARVMLGFEPLETLRGLPYLAPKGSGTTVVSNADFTPPLSVSLGRDAQPGLDHIREKTEACADRTAFLPAARLAREAGAVQSANVVLLGAFLGLGLLDFGLDRLKETIASLLPAKIVDLNLRAADLGAAALQ